ncbi:RNA binding protein [Oryctes borbonicus]|uniref:RNA binding protein n=1 Tax=Oryctes borbonicus TaxID=1629725 RepID=A0A0T6AZB4_9SCAR|nr:RNA binding protein [Oryctes borbonicus]
MPGYLRKVLETNPNKPVCPFFKKVGACRFGDACSRNHQRPCVSKILLILNFYSHISLEQSIENEYGSDALEFESHERYNHYKEFFYDVLPELEKFGEIKQFKACCNEEPHLRGNVYVEYSNTRQAVKAYRVFQARWYGGKQLNIEFCGIESWKNAICGLFFKRACPKGSACNFLHVFRNPGNLYNQIEKDVQPMICVNFDGENDATGRNWRWSESPERSVKSQTEDKIHTRHKSRENCQKRRSRSHKSRSRSKQRRRSRSPHGRSKQTASRKSHKRSKR